MKKTSQGSMVKEVQSYLKRMGVKNYQIEVKCFDGKIFVVTDNHTGRQVKDFFLEKGFKRSKRNGSVLFSKAIESV